jgi:hypothetical protein
MAHLLTDQRVIPGQRADGHLGKGARPGGQRQRPVLTSARPRQPLPEGLIVDGIHTQLMLAVGSAMGGNEGPLGDCRRGSPP